MNWKSVIFPLAGLALGIGLSTQLPEKSIPTISILIGLGVLIMAFTTIKKPRAGKKNLMKDPLVIFLLVLAVIVFLLGTVVCPTYGRPIEICEIFGTAQERVNENALGSNINVAASQLNSNRLTVAEKRSVWDDLNNNFYKSSSQSISVRCSTEGVLYGTHSSGLPLPEFLFGSRGAGSRQKIDGLC